MSRTGFGLGRRRLQRVLTGAAAVTLAVSLAACGGGTPGDQPSGPAAVGFDDAESATVRIEALGSLVDPTEGALEGGWWGSGLIVDPSGIAVTNNHVVVGAATLKVEVGGKKYDARILGTSECLDLAVIDLDGGNFPFFDWYEGDIKAALEVWALGFPNVGDRSFAVTKGIVSKPDTPSDTQWASVKHAIEHDARIRGGNSGGPLIASDGRVVGVNYAGSDQTDLNVAIHRDEVRSVFGDLSAGTNVLSLGINASAFANETGSGVFVSGVASGSAADTAGVRPGDILTKMEGVTLATDGTLADYCSIMRTHGTTAALSVEVLRPSEGATYAGQFNGRPLQVSSRPEPTGQPTGQASGTAAPELVVVSDQSGIVSVQVPAAWSEVDGTSYVDDKGNTIYDVTASTNLQSFWNSWSVSGASVSATVDGLDDYTPDSILDLLGATPAGNCTLDGARSPYSDALYTGSYEYWTKCGGVGTDFVTIAAKANDGSHLIWVQISMSAGDQWVLDPIVGSFIARF